MRITADPLHEVPVTTLICPRELLRGLRDGEVELGTFKRFKIIGSIRREFSLKSTFRMRQGHNPVSSRRGNSIHLNKHHISSYNNSII